MKTTLFITLAALFLLSGCKKEVALDTKQIHETDKNTKWEIDITHPTFSTTETSVEGSCTVFNDEISALVNGIKAAFVEQAKETIALLDSAKIQQVAPYQLLIQDTVFQANENYISVRLTSYEYIGGAHGITNFYALNYDIKTQKFLDKKQILDYTKAADINALLKTHLQDPDSCFSFETPTVENFTTVNLSLHSLEFTYAQYILGPYSCGYTTISIPRTKMEGLLLLK
ncbi:MAG: DUF4163 domain-containing protein [Odoribacter sp.]